MSQPSHNNQLLLVSLFFTYLYADSFHQTAKCCQLIEPPATFAMKKLFVEPSNFEQIIMYKSSQISLSGLQSKHSEYHAYTRITQFLHGMKGPKNFGLMLVVLLIVWFLMSCMEVHPSAWISFASVLNETDLTAEKSIFLRRATSHRDVSLFQLCIVALSPLVIWFNLELTRTSLWAMQCPDKSLWTGNHKGRGSRYRSFFFLKNG